MVKIDNWNDPELTEAFLIWSGHGDSIFPRRETSMIKQRFGSEADKWSALIEILANDFYKTNANFEAENLQEMWAMSIADFKSKYPDVPDQIAEALAWCYTFDNR